MIEWYIVLKVTVIFIFRRSIGWHLLQASEQLISQMTISRDIYLHCRMIDTVPLNMYKKAGYRVIKTDSLFTLLTFQRRKHLMCKKLPERHNLHSDMVGAHAEPASWRALLKSQRWCKIAKVQAMTGFTFLLPKMLFSSTFYYCFKKCVYYSQQLMPVSILLCVVWVHCTITL